MILHPLFYVITTLISTNTILIVEIWDIDYDHANSTKALLGSAVLVGLLSLCGCLYYRKEDQVVFYYTLLDILLNEILLVTAITIHWVEMKEKSQNPLLEAYNLVMALIVAMWHVNERKAKMKIEEAIARAPKIIQPLAWVVFNNPLNKGYNEMKPVIRWIGVNIFGYEP